MRKLRSQLYKYVPVFLQNIFVSWNGYQKARRIYDKLYYSFLLELEKQQYLNEYHAKKYQVQELQQLLHHAVANSPFYKEFYKNIDIEKVKNMDDLKNLPILNKEIFFKNIQSISTITENTAAESRVICEKGNALQFLYTKEDVQKKRAFLDFFKKQHGAVNLEMRRASFSCSRIIPAEQQSRNFWRDNYFMRQRIYSSLYCTQENAEVYIEDLEKYQPDFIDGLPSAIYELAKFINRNKIILTFKPVAIFHVGEMVQMQHRKEIENAFDCPVRNWYNSSGAAPFIMECVKGSMHYNLYSGVIEVGEKGNMIVTNFNSYGTPLIRYETDDRVELPNEDTQCECGSVHPIFGKIHTNHHWQPSSVSLDSLLTEYYSAILGKFLGTLNKF